MKGVLVHAATAAAIAAILTSCGGADRATRKAMTEWADVLQVHIATSPRNQFPERLGDVDPALRRVLTRTDAWGTELYYRRLGGDRYDLISAGPDGQLGNADDIVAVNGHFQDAGEVYARRPIERG